MQWMGWDWDQLRACPADLIPMIQTEYEAWQKRESGRRR